MVFSSKEFVFYFLPAALLVFYLSRALFPKRVSVICLLGLSFAFYSYWHAAYLVLLVGSYAMNYFGGNLLLRFRARWLLALLIAANLGILGYFKYLNFFVDNLNAVLGLGLANAKVVLPLGISFWTFQQIAYLVELYRQGDRADNFLNFCLFPSFFPHLIAGPIVYFKELKPLWEQPRHRHLTWFMFNTGVMFFFVGLFKKLVLADNLAIAADAVFKACEQGKVVTTGEAWVAAYSYALQLYFDFSGYSEMAIGLAMLFGVRFPINFFSPYKATSVIEFWRRWHMTMTRFFQTYLHTPIALAFARRSKWVGWRYLTILITMFVIGFWHGAGWTWLLWGVMHGFLLVGNHMFRAVRRWAGFPYNPTVATWRGLPFRAASWGLTVTLVTVCWVMFRAENMSGAAMMYRSMFALNGGITLPDDWSHWLGPKTTAALQAYGVHFRYCLNPDTVTEVQLFAVAALFLFCAVAPNTTEFMRYFADGRRRGIDWGAANTMFRTVSWAVWRPGWAAALLLGGMCALAFSSLIDDTVKSIFIYCQF